MRAPGSGGGRVDALRRSIPVVAQIALTTVLLFGAGLLLRSLSEMLDLARGFERDGVVILQTRLPEERYPAHADKRALYDEIEARLTATPAVTSMALADLPPYLMQRVHRGVEVERATGESELVTVEVLAVSVGFFETLRVPLVEGRPFRPAEPQPVVVINRTMARTYWPDGTAIGRQVGSDWLESQWGEAPPATVVGIVSDIRWGDLRVGGLALTGVMLGGIGARWASGVLEAYLFEVRPHDTWTFGAVAALVTATAIGAALPPAWRAARVDPMVVLDD